MTGIRTWIGLVLVLGLTAAAGVGVWAFYETEGGALTFHVTFKDAHGLEPGDDVTHADTVVGRIESVENTDNGVRVTAFLGARHVHVLRDDSRFWVHDALGGSILMFDTPAPGGPRVDNDAEFTGFEKRPPTEASQMPPQRERFRQTRPVWLGELRCVTVTFETEEQTFTVDRTSSCVVVAQQDDDLLALAPAWVAPEVDDLIERRARIELLGSEIRNVTVVARGNDLIIVRVPASRWRGKRATLGVCKTGTKVELLSFEGGWFVGEKTDDGLHLHASLTDARVVVAGSHVIGFALPRVGERLGCELKSLDEASKLLKVALGD